MASSKKSRSLGRPKMDENQIPTNEHILQVAMALFMESGFQKVSIDDVAQAADVTKATVYYYFDSKAELFKEALVALMKRIRERLDRLLSAKDSLYNRLLNVTKAHLLATTSLDLDSFMRESKSSLSEEQIEAMKLAEEKMYERIEQAFVESIVAGEIPNLDTKFAAYSYIALLKVGNYRDPDGQFLFGDYEEASIKIVNLLWKGLLQNSNLHPKK